MRNYATFVSHVDDTIESVVCKKAKLTTDILKHVKGKVIENWCLAFMKDILCNPEYVLVTRVNLIAEMVHNCHTLVDSVIPSFIRRAHRCSDRMQDIRSLCATSRTVFDTKEEFIIVMQSGMNAHDTIEHRAEKRCQSLTQKKNSLLDAERQMHNPGSDGDTLTEDVVQILSLTRAIMSLSVEAVWKLAAIYCFSIDHHPIDLPDHPETLRHVLLLALIRNFRTDEEEGASFYQLALDIKSAMTTESQNNLLSFVGDQFAHSFSTSDRGSHPQETREYVVPLLRSFDLCSHVTCDAGQSPNIPSLNRMVQSGYWETVPSQMLDQQVDRLIQQSVHFCSWMDKTRSGKLRQSLVDQLTEGPLVTFDRNVLRRALVLAQPFEVMRCFHISPIIKARRSDPTLDRRLEAKDVVDACLLVIMLCCVRNVVLKPLTSTNMKTVIVTSAARYDYEQLPEDMNIVFSGEDRQVLSTNTLEEVLNGIRMKHTVFV